MEEYFEGAVAVEGELIAPSVEALNSSESEYQGLVIQDPDVPLGYEEDNCGIHTPMLLLTFVFALYNLIRACMRAKALSKKTTSELNFEK